MNASNEKVIKSGDKTYVFDQLHPLGKGSFGTVYKAFDVNDRSSPLAVKVIPMKKIMETQNAQEQIEREIQILQQLKGENIVHLLDVMQTSNSLYILMDYCDEDSLESKIDDKKQEGEDFTEEEACSIIKQIASVFVDVENLQVVNTEGKQISMMHRDIKPANIMFHQGKVKLTDFGFAKTIEEVDKDIKYNHTLVGTPLYCPPQIFAGKNYSAKCDVWSTGIVLYELLFMDTPWKGGNPKELYQNIIKKDLAFPDYRTIKPELEDLLSLMLEREEADRPNWKQVIEHPALRDC